MKTGKVKRPTYGDGDGAVILTATLTRGSATRDVKFTATVKEGGMTDTQCMAQDKLWLDIYGKDAIKENLTLPSVCPKGSAVTWETSDDKVMTASGTITRPDNGQPAGAVTLTATLKKGAITETKTFACKVLAWTDAEEVDADAAEITWDTIKGLNIVKTDITTDLVLAKAGSRGTTIAWASTSTAMAPTGVLTRPSFTQGSVQFSLTATVTKKAVTKVIYLLALKANALPITNLEAVNRANALCEPVLFKGANANFPSVTENMVLPKLIASPDCSTVTLKWAVIKPDNSPDPTNTNVKIVDSGDSYTCTITRPAGSAANASVILQVTASSSLAAADEVSAYKTFNITVLKA